MKHRAFTLFEVIVVLVIIGVAAAILFPLFARSRESGHRSPNTTCQNNLKQISIGFVQYVQDNDEKFPPVAVAASGYWAGSLQPYVKSWQVFQCPLDKTGAAPKTVDYFYNGRLAGVDIAKISSLSQTILAGDGTDNQSTLYHLKQLPASWLTDQSSPAWRHLDGANYAFADGHFKWLKPTQVTAKSPRLNQPTFLVK